jgi:hypothetical protein
MKMGGFFVKGDLGVRQLIRLLIHSVFTGKIPNFQFRK